MNDDKNDINPQTGKKWFASCIEKESKKHYGKNNTYADCFRSY
jgi:hypothetical protein